jgi:multisubunit Na+/H+ antiporter MnhC subunit
MFKIVAVVFIGILAGIGFFAISARKLTHLLLGIGALLDHGRRSASLTVQRRTVTVSGASRA